MTASALVIIAGEEFTLAPDRPFVFGREGVGDVVGLDHRDMGISAEAGSVEWDRALWWVVNRSRKRPLLLDGGGGRALQRLEAGRRTAIDVARSSVLVPGVIHTHRLDVFVPVEDVVWFQPGRPPSGTLTGEVHLSEPDRSVMAALLSGYLQEFPRREPRPRSYQQAADLLGPPWTKTTVRKRVERLKHRLADAGVYMQGPQANFELADYLIDHGVVTSTDFGRLPARP